MIDIRKYKEDLFDKCSSCGFCYDFCPIYSVGGAEAESSGFGNARQKDMLGKIDIFFKMENLLSSCLLCKACFPSCSSGARPDEVIQRAREILVDSHGLSLGKNMLLKTILPYPKRMAFVVKIASLMRKIGLIYFAKKLKITTSVLRIVDAIPINTPIKSKNTVFSDNATVIKARDSVTYFESCGFNHFLPEVRESTINVLRNLGYKVVISKNNCCGLPPYANGDTKTAKEMAKRNILLLESSKLILTECGSCSSFLKKYQELLAEEPDYAEKAEKLSARIKDTLELFSNNISNFMSHFVPSTQQALKVTYHDPCHLSRYQGITREPREIIRAIPGIEFIELSESDGCCGGPGLYSATQNDISMKILDRKIHNIRKTGANVLATSCPACMIQFSHGIKQAGLSVDIMHVNQLLARSLVTSK